MNLWASESPSSLSTSLCVCSRSTFKYFCTIILLHHHHWTDLVCDKYDGHLLGCSNFGNQVSVLHCLVETVPATSSNIIVMLMRILQNTNIKVINENIAKHKYQSYRWYDFMIRQPVSDAVADDKTLPTAHILLPHSSKFNLKINNIRISISMIMTLLNLYTVWNVLNLPLNISPSKF